MRSVTCSLTVSLDGYVAGPDGGLDWGSPEEEVFRFATDEVRDLGVHLLGRRLYEAMLYWEDADQKRALSDAQREFFELWTSLPKVVFSTTLSAVQGNARLATLDLAGEVARLRAEPGEGDIGIGGATLAGEAAAQDLLDEYRLRVCPVLLGGGAPMFPRTQRQVDLELVESRVLGSQVVFTRHRVVRRPAESGPGLDP